MSIASEEAEDRAGADDGHTTCKTANDEAQAVTPVTYKVQWHHSTLYNALVLGMCNFLTPGIWAAMNSLGAGGAEKPYLVNAANALTFSLMVLSCSFSSVLVHHTSIRFALFVGTLGYAPYAAGLYANNRYGNEWLLLLGAALCGLSAGVFWMAQMAIAISYPEPYNQGRFLGLWLSFNVAGQVLGGAISLGLNVNNPRGGKIGNTVYLIFIALQAIAPLSALLLNPPSKVQRKDGVQVQLKIPKGNIAELKRVSKLFISKEFLLLIPLIAQSFYTEAVMFTFETLWFSVRARALGSFLSGIVAILFGNLFGAFLDIVSIKLMTRARSAYILTMATQGGWWIWASILVTEFERTQPVYDWEDTGFASPFVVFLALVAWFQVNSMILYGCLFLFVRMLGHSWIFLVGHVARSQAEVVRISGLLRGTQSAVQAVSYGIGSIKIMAMTGNIYFNLGLWAISLVPGWVLVKKIGVSFGDRKLERESKDSINT